MRHMGGQHFSWRQKHTATTIGGGVSVSAHSPSTTNHQQCYCFIRKLVRKVRKHSKLLCSAARPTTFQCRYDPSSYARNFDCSSGSDNVFDDGSHRSYTFSSRFAAAPSNASTMLAKTQ
ncbi:hypothetical protein ACLOJK_020108 [Asimina triloba]